MARFSLQKRQYILLGLAFILLLAVVYRYSPGLALIKTGNDEIAAQKERLAKYQALKEKKSRLEKEKAELDQQLSGTESFFLRGETPDLAAVDLQNRLKDLAGSSDVELKSVRVIKPPRQRKDEKKSYQEIPVKISLEVTIRQLKEILHAIAASRVLLRATDMTVKVDSRKDWLLNTDMTITGLRSQD